MKVIILLVVANICMGTYSLWKYVGYDQESNFKESVCESNDIHAVKPVDNVAINCDDVN